MPRDPMRRRSSVKAAEPNALQAAPRSHLRPNTDAEMARLYNVSAPTMSRIVAAHRIGLAQRAVLNKSSADPYLAMPPLPSRWHRHSGQRKSDYMPHQCAWRRMARPNRGRAASGSPSQILTSPP
jgi:hypothetical protein